MMRSLTFLFTASLLLASDGGLTPRQRPSDYPVHQTASGVTLAAAIVPVKQIERMFSTEIAKHYIVVEVAVYPENGGTIDVGFLDFGLKMGDIVTHPEKPRDIAEPWPDKGPTPKQPVTVLTTTGVVYTKSSDPVYGKHSSVGVYQDTAVTNDPRAIPPPPPPRQGADPRMIEDRVRENILLEGPTSTPIAGFLFFPQYKKRGKGTAMDLEWSKDGASVVLRLPEK